MERQVDEIKPTRYTTDPPALEQWMKFILSLIIAAVALYVIAGNKASADSQKWAAGAIGAILGHWFRR